MTDRVQEMCIKARECVESASKIRVCFEEMNRYQGKTTVSAAKVKDQLKELSTEKVFAGLVKGAEGISSAFKDTLSKGMKDINVNYSKFAEEYVKGIQRTASDVLGAMGISAAGEKPDTKVQEELTRTTEQGLSSQDKERGKGGYYNDLIRQQQDQQQSLDDKQKTLDTSKTMTRTHAEEVSRIDAEMWDKRLRTAGYASGSLANIMQNLYVVSGSKNKAMFESMKAFAIAETVIQTYRAAQGAYAALASINPALGIAAAAAAIAAGMARVKMIASTNPGGATGTIGADGKAQPSYSGGSPSAYPVPQRLEDYESRQTQHITIQIYNPLSEQNWQKIVEDNIIPAINGASDKNISVVVKTVY